MRAIDYVNTTTARSTNRTRETVRMTKVSRSETATRRCARATVDGDGGGGEDAGGGTAAAAARRDGGAEATTRDGGGGAWTAARVNAVNANGGVSVGKRRRGRPRRSAKAVMMETKPRDGEGRRDAATEAYAEWARRLAMYHVSYYHHHHHHSMGQFPHYAYGGYGSTMVDYARFQPPTRPDAAPETPNARAEGDASQKQWPIVPQVSTAICPPRSDLVRSTPPGEFGKREAVNAGVQEASAAKSKAKAEAAEARHDDGAARSSRDDQRAAKKATEAAAKRVNEAKALLDPSAALDRNALARDSVQKDMRQRRSTAPSPESSNSAEQPGSEALGSKGSKSAAAA